MIFIKKGFIQFLLICTLLIQGLIVIFGDPASIVRAGNRENELALQGIKSEELFKTLESTKYRPEPPGEISLVRDVKPGEGKDFPRAPLSARPVHPLLSVLLDNSENPLKIEGGNDGYRLMLYWAVLLDSHPRFALNREQVLKLHKIFKMKDQIDDNLLLFRKTCLETLTRDQLAYIQHYNKCGQASFFKGESSSGLRTQARILKTSLEKSISRKGGGMKKTSSPLKHSPCRWCDPGLSRWELSELVGGLNRLQKNTRLYLKTGQAERILPSLKKAIGCFKYLEESNKLAVDILTARQMEYLIICFSDTSYMKTVDFRFKSVTGLEPVMGVNFAMYHSCRKMFKRRTEK